MASSNVGRPLLQINVEDVENMKKTGMTMTEITRRVGISRSTLLQKVEGLKFNRVYRYK